MHDKTRDMHDTRGTRYDSTTRQEICTIREVHDMTVREYAIRVYYWYERFIDIVIDRKQYELYTNWNKSLLFQCDTIRLSDKSLLFRYDTIKYDTIRLLDKSPLLQHDTIR